MNDTSVSTPVSAGASVATTRVHVLVDLENNQPTLDEVKALVPDVTDVWLFHSGAQARHLASFAPLGPRQTSVPIARPGKNSLDFHLSFYLGYIAAKNPGVRLVVVAIDGGYAPMVEHAVKTLGFDVRRVSAQRPKAKEALATQTKPPAKKAPAKSPTPKPVAKKAPAKKGLAKEASAKKPPAKKVPAKKAKAPAQKVSAKTPAKKTVVAKTKDAPSVGGAGDKALDRLVKSLRKMGNHAPSRAKAYRQHLKSMLGKDATEDVVEAAAAGLAKRGVATIEGANVRYRFS